MKRLVGTALTAGVVWGMVWLLQAGCVGDTPVAPPTTPDASTGAKTCTKPSDCSSGFCADGYCCDSMCTGTCEACNVAGALGVCTAIPDGQDPANECAGGDAGGGGFDASGDGALNLPDGGISLDGTKCGGKCNGKRACALADAKVTCSTPFCNDNGTQGRGACNGAGGCDLVLETCKEYACPDGTGDAGAANGCLSQCAGEADCQPTHYCAQGKCLPKVGNGSVCNSVAQCQSAHCVSGVCCNDECQVTGGSCTSSGKVGQCTCPACSTGPCALWYKDGDNDGYGDATGTIGNGRAIVGCAQLPDAGPPTPPQPGFVLNNTDCFDALATVHPGQTTYFTTPYGPSNSFDYNCDNTITKETVEFPNNGSCGFCSGISVCSKNTTCTTAGQQSFHACYPSIFVNTQCNGGLFNVPLSAFQTSVACGGSGTLFTCGKCSSAGGTPAVTTAAKTQACR